MVIMISGSLYYMLTRDSEEAALAPTDSEPARRPGRLGAVLRPDSNTGGARLVRLRVLEWQAQVRRSGVPAPR